ncbi:MAG: hypothetical protein KJ626_07105 [Verrucomicrobia bacterium]|nr:hypothetical protein [Verrucomicrobiota bacterium]
MPEGEGKWVVIHARPRCEKKIVRYCEDRGLGVYLPLVEKEHRYGGRIRRFSSPLFKGYVFCAASADERMRLGQNSYVANLLTVLDQAQLVSQLRQVRSALASGNRIEVMPYLKIGNQVRVTGGPMKGLEGVVARMKGEARVILNVDMIQQAVAVEVDFSLLEAV